jgi:hypothetical protein
MEHPTIVGMMTGALLALLAAGCSDLGAGPVAGSQPTDSDPDRPLGIGVMSLEDDESDPLDDEDEPADEPVNVNGSY